MTTEYDRYSKLFHWSLAVAVLVQFVSAWISPEEVQSPEALVNFHMSFGILILVLMLARFGWRLFTDIPPPHAQMPDWQARISVWTHYAFYALLILMPLLGWLWASLLGWQVTLFGLVNLPYLVAAQPSLAELVGEAHAFVGTAIMLLIGLHVSAALYHWLILKDDVLQRMWP
jgi:cytochrome b561